MTVFGNHTHHTDSDKRANCGLGALQLFFFTFGLPLNAFIYYFNSKKRVSWTARFYRYLSAAGFLMLLFGALPQGVYLLIPQQVVEINKFFNEVLALLCSCCWAFQKIVITMLCLMQYIYIHRPYWALVYGTRFKKLAMLALVWVVVFYVVVFSLSLIFIKNDFFGFYNRYQIFYARGTAACVVYLVGMHISEFACMLFSLGIYVVTLVKLRRSDVETTLKIRSDFAVIAVLNLCFALWAVGRIFITARTWDNRVTEIPNGYEYLIYFMGNVYAPLFSFVNALAVILCYSDVRRSAANFLKTGKVNTLDYEEL